jgi:hypothetical protein
MINIIKWWNELPWKNKKLDEAVSPDSLKRKRPLTWRELFFRDKVAVITNLLPISLLIVLLIMNLVGG